MAKAIPSDITLLWLSSNTYSSEATTVSHSHEYFQIHLVRSGRATFVLNGEEVTLTRDMVLFTRPGETHCLTKAEEVDGEPYRMYEIKFAAEGTIWGGRLAAVPGHFILQKDSLDLIDQLFSEAHNQKEFCQEAATHLLCALLFRLSRREITNSSNETRLSTYSNQMHICTQVEEYIAAHYAQDISLDDIAEHVGCSKNHLCRVYRSHTGSTINELLNTVRVRKATELLVQTDLELEAIASASGYHNIYHFIKTFKKIMKISPGSFRRNNMSGWNVVRNQVWYENIFMNIGVIDVGELPKEP